MGKFHSFTPFFLLHCFINSFPFLTFSFTLLYITQIASFFIFSIQILLFFLFYYTKNVNYFFLLRIKNKEGNNLFTSFIFLSLINAFIGISLGYTAYQLFRKAIVGDILTCILACSAPIMFV